MSVMLRGFFPPGDPGGSACTAGISKAVWPIAKVLDRDGHERLRGASDGELSSILDNLHAGLVTLANSRGKSVPRPVLPAQHPPKFARLREDAAAEAVADQLAQLVNEGVELYEAAGKGSPPGSVQGARNWSRFEHLLEPFLTAEVRQRYQASTYGFGCAELLATGQTPWPTINKRRQREFQEIAAGIAPRVHAAYVGIAINYLAEVLELMPDYAEASGQGKRRDPVTVYGNVGAIHSEVNNSHISVADTVTSIGATITTIADRGETDVAAALRGLTEAIQQAPELAEDRRAQLLDSAADIADAAVAPEEPRRLNRARNAMAAITAAAGASSQIAQAVDAWHQAAGHLL
ncbi:hypothetical protein ACIQB5_47250 [Streptomyces sp. NPDC088560]|uniref:hypothetical protein n=1 Tax=Streptomyces sp. NPDC088560 TaxID=3365868 RepID=UPI00382B21DB